MPQMSIPYAVGRIRVLQRDALDSGRLERLISTASLQEATRALSEIGWAGAEGLEYEQATMQHVEKACSLIKEISPEPAVTDCFLIRYDIHNLKTLLKARCLGEKAEILSPCGTLPVTLLQHAVADHTYKKLPPILSVAMEALEKRLAVQVDALVIDVMLDHAMYRIIFESLHNKRYPVVRKYFQGKVDLTNAVMLLRAKAMGREESFFQEVLLENGTIPKGEWSKLFSNPEKLAHSLEAYGKRVTLAVKAAVQSNRSLPALEKAMDDYLLSLFLPYRLEPLSLEPLIGYLLACERESAAVRLIMAGKANGFAPEAIRERMRDLYGR